MAYNGDKTWEDLSGRAGSGARNVISALTQGVDHYNEWQSFRAGRTNAQIAAALPLKQNGDTVTEAEVADMDSCYAAMLSIDSFANNGVEPQGDYFFSLRKFS